MNNIAIIKVSEEHMQLAGNLSRLLAEAINGAVFVFPLDSEVLLGRYAKAELNRIHKQIHDLTD